MSDKKDYYSQSHAIETRWGVQWEMRSDLAWDLLKHFGSVAAKTDGEDKAGRAKLELQEPAEVVERVFTIVDLFVERIEQRGGLRPEPMTQEQRAERYGKLERIKNDAAYRLKEVDDAVKKTLEK
jgi:hypothetical protein